MCRYSWTLQHLLLQEEGKHLSRHTSHSAVAIGGLTFYSDTLILREYRKYKGKGLYCFKGQHTPRQIFVYKLQAKYKKQPVFTWSGSLSYNFGVTAGWAVLYKLNILIYWWWQWRRSVPEFNVGLVWLYFSRLSDDGTAIAERVAVDTFLNVM
jgi:hypothetical protein